MKAEKSKRFHCETSRFLSFLVTAFKEIKKKLFKICFDSMEK